MGIHKLMSLIQSLAPEAIKSVPIKSLNGRYVACDASMAMYQFVISTQSFKQGSSSIFEMKDQEGNLTGHLVGLFYRTINLMEHGVRPVWVFDGKAPDEKMKELEKRKERKEEAEEEKKEALAAGDMEKAVKMAGRSVHITSEMVADAKNMLRLMGMPVVEAPGEAEAQCSILAKEGKVWATVSEDMDSLTFGTPVLLRGFKSVKEPLTEINLQKVLDGFGFEMKEFVDLCILCGCDYMRRIGGIGPVKAYDLVKKKGDLEGVLKALREVNADPKKRGKYEIPANWDYQKTRLLFSDPMVKPAAEFELSWKAPDDENLQAFLVENKGFSKVNVSNGITKLKEAAKKTGQKRLDSFFKLAPAPAAKKEAKPMKKPTAARVKKSGGGKVL